MANKNKKVLIAGGGIGGITALLALRQRGIEAELFEQAAAFGQVGAGLQVSGNATRILRALGLGEALARVAYYPQGRDYRAWDSGDRLYYTPLGERAEQRFGAPYYTAHRADRARISATYREILDAMWLFNDKFERALAEYQKIKAAH